MISGQTTGRFSVITLDRSRMYWHGDLFTNEKNLHSKKSHRVILRSPLPKIHYYHNKQLQVKEFQ